MLIVVKPLVLLRQVRMPTNEQLMRAKKEMGVRRLPGEDQLPGLQPKKNLSGTFSLISRIVVGAAYV